MQLIEDLISIQKKDNPFIPTVPPHPLKTIDSVTPTALTFEYKEFGVMGVGCEGRPVVPFDSFLDTSIFFDLHDEVCIGLSKCSNFSFGKVVGAPPIVLQSRLQSTFAEDMLSRLNEFDPTGRHLKHLENLHTWEERCKYMYFAMGAIIPWYFEVFLLRQTFFDKTKDNRNWCPEAQYFPNLKNFIENKLPFKRIGRVVIFSTFPNCEVPIHRDFVVEPHKDHNINFFFDKWRPSFVYDETIKERIYLPSGTRSYFFNNRDYHGVEPENRFRYTVRVDGTFTEEFQRILGLEDGYVFKWEYPTGQRWLENQTKKSL